MSYEKFSSLDEYQLPKILELASHEKELVYFGTYHSNDPTDSLFDFIRARIDSLDPDYVLHEGGDNWPIYPKVDSTISVSGEPGFIIQHCQEKEIEYSSIEPPASAEYARLLELYDLDWVVLMYLCRQVDNQQRFMTQFKTTDEDFERNINYFLSQLKTDGVPIRNEQTQYPYWQGRYLALIGKELDWRTFDPSEYYPNFNKTKMNEVNRASDQFRNEWMVEIVLKILEQHDRVFILVGGGHLIIQEAVLKHKFKKRF
ncbi:MAG: hypothetical protein AAGC47_03930 [Bacteroidota bacterium]